MVLKFGEIHTKLEPIQFFLLQKKVIRLINYAPIHQVIYCFISQKC